jgi:cytochrome b involved in lipid metabolism
MSKNKITLVIAVLVIFAIVSIYIISNNSKTLPTTVPNQTVAEQLATTTNNKSYTLAEIATHATGADCWSTINGNVYNLTSWISKHPGGAKAIISLCGRDGSSDFNGQHGGQRRPANELAGFDIGVLKN